MYGERDVCVCDLLIFSQGYADWQYRNRASDFGRAVNSGGSAVNDRGTAVNAAAMNSGGSAVNGGAEAPAVLSVFDHWVRYIYLSIELKVLCSY